MHVIGAHFRVTSSSSMASIVMPHSALIAYDARSHLAIFCNDSQIRRSTKQVTSRRTAISAPEGITCIHKFLSQMNPFPNRLHPTVRAIRFRGIQASQSVRRPPSVSSEFPVRAPSGLAVDDQFRLGPLLERQITHFSAVEDLAGVDADLTIHGCVDVVAHQPSSF